MNLKALQQQCAAGEACLVWSPENRRYLTGFPSSDGVLLFTKDTALFFTDSRYIEAAQNTVTDCDDVVLLTRLRDQLPEALRRLGAARLLTEAERLTVRDFRSISDWAGVPCAAEALDERINALRRRKSAREKEKICAAQRIAEAAFEEICRFLRPGVTERETALTLDQYMLRAGAEALSFETIVVSGANGSMPHGVPGDKKIEPGDFVTLDFGAVVDGYHSDMTRTVAVGTVSDAAAQVYETVLRAQEAGLAALAPGVACKAADAAARDVITAAGYGDCFGHGTGHGVGVEIHEQPTLNPRSTQTLAPGDVVTVEPGIYLPGRFGVRIEDMAFLTETGADNLTACPKQLRVL